MMEYEILGNSVQTWIISLLFVLGAFVVVKLISFLSRKFLEPLVRGWTTSSIIRWSRL